MTTAQCLKETDYGEDPDFEPLAEKRKPVTIPDISSLNQSLKGGRKSSSLPVNVPTVKGKKSIAKTKKHTKTKKEGEDHPKRWIWV